MVRWALIKFLNAIGAEPFISLNASDFLWGYEDKFSMLARGFLSFRYDLPFKKFGILSSVSFYIKMIFLFFSSFRNVTFLFFLKKNGTQKDVVTIYTGEKDPSKTGIVVNYDGKTSLNYWNSVECNR